MQGTVFNDAKIAPILELLKDVWANGDGAVYEYLLNWFAYPLQRKRKTGVCLVVISEQGYGKGTIAHDLLGCGIYGEVKNNKQDGCYTQITDIDDIVGKFNSQSCGCHFINADECSSYSAAYRMNNKFKNLITASSRRLESKGVDAVTVSDATNYLLTTNNPRPIKVETSDRRFVVLVVDHERKKSPAFFKKLHECMRDGAPLHFYKLLMARELADDFDPQTHRPVTTAARAMMKEQVPPHIRFIQECADAESLPAVWGERQPWEAPVHLSLEELYTLFVDWAKKRQTEHVTNDVHFSEDLSKYAGIGNGVRSKRGTTKVLPRPEQVRHTCNRPSCILTESDKGSECRTACTSNQLPSTDFRLKNAPCLELEQEDSKGEVSQQNTGCSDRASPFLGRSFALFDRPPPSTKRMSLKIGLPRQSLVGNA